MIKNAKLLMGQALLILLLLSLLPAVTMAVETVPPMISVVTGESRILAVNSVTRVALAEESIADLVVVSPTEIIINGKKPGVTTLHVWDKGGRREYLVKVYVDNSTLAAEIAEAIADPLISVRVLRQTVFLEGTAETTFAATRAEKIALAYEDKVVNLIQVPLASESEIPVEADSVTENSAQPVGPNLQDVAKEIMDYLDGEGFTARVFGNGILVEGNVASEEHEKRISAVAEFFSKQAGCDVTVVANVVPNRGPKVALQVQVLEISNEVMDSFGVTWGSLYNGGVLPYEIMFGQMGLEDPIERLSPIGAKLNFMVQNGDARVLAAPSLVTNSGVQADFLAGGEIPVPVPSGDTLSILWKEYGVKLSMLPVVFPDGKINLQVAPEVSSLDMTNAIKLDSWVIPALKTRRTKTQVDLANGETLIIGGLISNEQAKMVQKVPLLGSIPIIGQLFSSTEFKDGKTQLLIMVTPQIITDDSQQPNLNFYLQDQIDAETQEVFKEIPNPLVPRLPQKESDDNGPEPDQSAGR